MTYAIQFTNETVGDGSSLVTDDNGFVVQYDSLAHAVLHAYELVKLFDEDGESVTCHLIVYGRTIHTVDCEYLQGRACRCAARAVIVNFSLSAWDYPTNPVND